MIEFDEDSEDELEIEDEDEEPEYERDENGRIVIRLKEPVHHKHRVVDTLHVRKGNIGDLKNVSVAGVTFKDLIVIAARMAGEERAVIEKLGEDDAAVIRIALRFLGRCLSNGQTG